MNRAIINDLLTLIKIYNPEGKPMTPEAIEKITERLPLTPQRYGEWKRIGDKTAECTYCGAVVATATLFCPRCGAKNID